MGSKGKQPRTIYADKRVKFGTTVLKETDTNMELFRKQYPEYRSPGRVIDLMAGLCLRVNPDAATELLKFCSDRDADITKQLKDAEDSALETDNLKAEREYFRKLAKHMSKFIDASSPEAPHVQISTQPSVMKRVDLQDGSYVVIPNDWIVFNEKDAKSCNYAYVVEIRNSAVPNLPHVVMLTPMEQCPYERAIDAAAQVSPEIKEALGQIVDPQYDESHELLNKDAVLKNPIVGVFPIRDSLSYEWGEDAPYGAMVYRP